MILVEQEESKLFSKRKISQNYIRIISFTKPVHTKKEDQKTFLYGQKQPNTKRSTMLKSKNFTRHKNLEMSK
jgi:hypothetical protein